MIAHKADAIRTRIKPLHHIEGLVSSSNQCRLAEQVLWVEIAHMVMRVVDHKFRRPALQSTRNDRIHLIREQPSSLLIFGISFNDLLPGSDAAGTFEIS